MPQVRVSLPHKSKLDLIVEDSKLNRKQGEMLPTQESILNALIDKDFKRRGLKNGNQNN